MAVAEAAALGGDAEAWTPTRWHQRNDRGIQAGVHVQHADAVGAHDTHAHSVRGLGQAPLKRGTFVRDLAEAAGNGQQKGCLSLRAVLDRLDQRFTRKQRDDEIDRRWQVAQRRHGWPAGDGGLRRIDGDQLTLERRGETPEHLASQLVGAGRSTKNRDRAWREESAEVGACHRVLQ